MLAPWLELPGLAGLADQMSAAADLDLARMGTSAPAEEIKDTAITQPLVVATTLLAASALQSRTDVPAAAPTAGHSVGELAAAALAGVIDPITAVSLAARRGAAMAACCAAAPTAMSAVLGGATDDVLAALAERGLVGANVNGGGQIVAAGARQALALLKEDPLPGNPRIIPLAVAGAFHTSYMAGAQDDLAAAVADIAPADPVRPLLTNADGRVVSSGAEYMNLLVHQLTRPVRWDACMATLSALGVTGVIEFPPAGALTGLIKRELKSVATLALKGPDELAAASGFVAEHGPATGPAADPSSTITHRPPKANR